MAPPSIRAGLRTSAQSAEVLEDRVLLAMTSLILTASAGTVNYGQTETLTATVASSAGAPSVGTVTFKDGATTLASGVAVVNGVATFQTPSLSVGFHALSATYTGAGSYQGSQTVVGPSSVISTVAHLNTPQRSSWPTGVALDASGNIFVSDCLGFIFKVDRLTGKSTPVAPAIYPLCVAVDATGQVFFADSCNNIIRKLDPATGVITTIAGNGTKGYSGDGGPATSAQFNYPSGVAVDAAGNVFIADTNNNRIRKVDHATGIVTLVAGSDNVLWSTDHGDGGAATSATLTFPESVAVDALGNVFISDTALSLVRKVDHATGIITTVAGDHSRPQGFSGDGGAATSAQLNHPFGLALDASGNIFFADSSNYRVREVDHVTGVITTVAGNGGYGSSGDGGAATSAQLTAPEDVAVDAAGNVIIADTFNQSIREVVAGAGVTVDPIGFFPISGTVNYTAFGAHTLVAWDGLLNDPTAQYATSSLSVQTTNGGPNDRLVLAKSNAGVQSVTGGSGTAPLVITFTAAATRDSVQAALQNVAFYNVTSRPSLTDRTVQFTFTNGANVQSSRSATVHMTAGAFVNWVPATVNYIAADPAVKLAPAGTLADDNPNAFANSRLKVTNTNGGSSDVLGISAGGNLTVGTGTLSYTGIGPMGTFSGGDGQNPLVATFNGSATAAAVQAVLRSINVSNPKSGATPFDRTLSVQFIDSSNAQDTRIQTIHLVTRPTLTGLGNTSYALSTSPAQTPLAAAAVVNMPSGHAPGAVLSIQLLNGGGNDRMTIQTGAGATTALVGGVNQVSVGGTQVGTYAFTGGASNNLTLTITFNSSATAGSIQAVLRNVAYYNLSPNASVYNRTVEFKLTDGTSPTPVSSKAIDTSVVVSQ